MAPDGGIVLEVRTFRAARRAVSGWIRDEIAQRRFSADARFATASKARSGRPAKLLDDFVEVAGKLWRNAKYKKQQRIASARNVTHKELARIAKSLDREGYIPPAD